MEDFAGNLFVHAGSHHLLTEYMTAVAVAFGAFSAGGATAVSKEEQEQRVAQLDALKPLFGPPQQVQLRCGDVVLVLQRIAHGISPNLSGRTRKMVYFRASHCDHAARQLQALQDIWVEYEGMQEVL